MRRSGVLLVLAALALLAPAAGAVAAPPALAPPTGELLLDVPGHELDWVGAGFRLPGPVITYADLTGGRYPGMVESAVAAWNASGMRAHLVPGPVTRAEVILKVGDAPFQQLSCTNGVTGVAFGGPSGSTIWIAKGCADRLYRYYVATHELGHALGLDHEDARCATMGSSNLVMDRTCGSWFRPCRLLQADDALGAVRLYGGKRASTARIAAAVCNDRAPRRLRSFTVLAEPAGRLADAALTLRARGSAPFETIVLRRRGTCPKGFRDRRAEVVRARTGSTQLVRATAAGRWCYAAWPVSRGGRVGPALRRTVRHGVRSTAQRLALAVARRPSDLAPVVSWRHPKAPRPRFTAVQAHEGGCGTGFASFGQEVAVLRTGTAGATAQVVDDDLGRIARPGSWCYRLAFYAKDPRTTFSEPVAEARVRLVVPAAAPVAAIALDRDPAPAYGTGEVVTATATASDPDGGDVELAWSTSDGQIGSGPTASFSFASAGAVTITLTATDDEGVATSTSRTLQIT